MHREGRFTVKVIPNARQESVEEIAGGFTVRVRVSAREGKANERMIELLAEHLRLAKSLIRITSGHTARIKHIHIS